MSLFIHFILHVRDRNMPPLNSNLSDQNSDREDIFIWGTIKIEEKLS